jgi:hypothetical protein
MKKSIVIFIACVAMLAFVVKPGNDFEKLRWLKGVWMMKKKNGKSIMELWLWQNDSTMEGESHLYAGPGSSQLLESLSLVERDKEYFYISKVVGQNDDKAVRFKLTSYSENGFVAENPEHDFPKRITYKLVNKDSLHAFIDGGPAMPDKRSDFYFSRTTN